MQGFAGVSGGPLHFYECATVALGDANSPGVILIGAVNMITQREVEILMDVLKEQTGFIVPTDAASAALYAVADYNFGLIPQKREPHKYVTADKRPARFEPGLKSGSTANIRPSRPAKIRLVHAQPYLLSGSPNDPDFAGS